MLPLNKTHVLLKAVGVDAFRYTVCSSSEGYCSLLSAIREADTRWMVRTVRHHFMIPIIFYGSLRLSTV